MLTRIDPAKIVDIRMDSTGRYHWDVAEPANGLFNMSWTGYRTVADAKRSALEQGSENQSQGNVLRERNMR